MSQFELTKTRLANGIWEGIVSSPEGGDIRPNIQVLHRDQPVPNVEVAAQEGEGHWAVRIPVPSYAISDGVHTFTIVDTSDQSQLGHFDLLAGEVLADDIRAEIELLRAELDMLKRAFRRHCLETT